MIPRILLAVGYDGRASNARQVKGDNPDKKGYPGPPGWRLGLRLTATPLKNISLRNLRGGQDPLRAVEPMMIMMMMMMMMMTIPVPVRMTYPR